MLKINKKKSKLLLGTVPIMDLGNSQGSYRAFCALVPTLMTALADILILKASSPSPSWWATGPMSPGGILTSAEPGRVSFSGVNNGAAEVELVLAAEVQRS